MTFGNANVRTARWESEWIKWIGKSTLEIENPSKFLTYLQHSVIFNFWERWGLLNIQKQIFSKHFSDYKNWSENSWEIEYRSCIDNFFKYWNLGLFEYRAKRKSGKYGSKQNLLNFWFAMTLAGIKLRFIF